MKPGDRVRWYWRKGRVPFTCTVLLIGEHDVTVELNTGSIRTVPKAEVR